VSRRTSRARRSSSWSPRTWCCSRCSAR
jgi:hypothetical protein